MKIGYSVICSQQLPISMDTEVDDSSSGTLPESNTSASSSRIDKTKYTLPVHWSSLGALLLYFVGADGSRSSEKRTGWFLDLAQHTFERLVNLLGELNKTQSTSLTVDRVQLDTFHEQLKHWPRPEALSQEEKPIFYPEVLGQERKTRLHAKRMVGAADVENEVHVHPPHGHNGRVFHGTVLYELDSFISIISWTLLELIHPQHASKRRAPP